MTAISQYRERKHMALRLAIFVLALTACSPSVHAQTEDYTSPLATTTTTPYTEFQYSTLTGSGNTVTATMLPIVTSSGSIVYKNLTLQFNVDSSGNVTLGSGYPKVVNASTPLISAFVAGNYGGPSNIYAGKNLVTVTGPGVAPGGATEWSLAASSEAAQCTYPTTATWYVGPIASNPLAARLTKAGITSTAWSYGILGSPYCGPNNYWDRDTLIGVSQTGHTLTIVSFSYIGTEDSSTPQDQITFTLQ